MEKLENREICEKCGGICCKKSGCDYFIEDFESLKLEPLEQKLKEGKISIIAVLNFKRLPNGKLTCETILYLRARNKNRGIVDLLSMKTTCASLTPTGCEFSFEKRPSGGKTLIPKENLQCYSNIDRIEKLKEWIPYQRILSKIVKRLTGKSVIANLKEDVVNLLYNIYRENFPEVSNLEILDILDLAPFLIEAFPEEGEKAYNKYISEKNLLIKTPKKA